MAKKYIEAYEALTDKQKVVVDEIRRGRSWTAAARAAGYSDPNGEVTNLKRNWNIVDAILEPLQRRNASWEMLGEKAKRRLNRNLMLEHADDCRIHEPAHEEYGYAPCTCGFARIRAADGNQAAKIVMDALRRGDPDTFAGRAKKEDLAAETNEKLANVYLGEEEDKKVH